MGIRTCDVLVEQGVLVYDIVEELPAVRVDNQHFPLRISLVLVVRITGFV